MKSQFGQYGKTVQSAAGKDKWAMGQIFLNKIEWFTKEICIRSLDIIAWNESETCAKIYVMLDNVVKNLYYYFSKHPRGCRMQISLFILGA